MKAVVLRVNSPGGSVSASEKVRDALDLLGKEKPRLILTPAKNLLPLESAKLEAGEDAEPEGA